jgi:hypothetical protein
MEKMYKKVNFFLFNCPFRGGDEIRSFSLVLCDEIKHRKTDTCLWQIENIFEFFVTFQRFQTLF